MEQDTTCCDEPMKDLGDVDFMNMNLNFCHRFVCAKCFRIIDISDYSVDDEELESLEGFNDELDKSLDLHLKELGIRIDEKKEARADLIRKYDIPSEAEAQENFCN